ncbi:MAG: hypothetical protein GEU28_01295 [Dehalococcoidia bacterium]|nr:hypothetical protein [Dehalococcoidia bacterium]
MFASLSEAVRANHGLEHATVSILLSKPGAQKRLFGHAVPDGFYLYGNVDEESFRDAAHEALARMKAGEDGLAVSPLCGTNIVISGIAAGLVSLATVHQPNRFSRFPNIVTATSLGIVLGQPLGRWFQKNVTTSPRVHDMEIVDISRGFWPGKPFRVRTRRTGGTTTPLA